MTDQQICDTAEKDFLARFRPKFEAGMKKYASPITEKDCLAEAKVEVLDLWAYLNAEEERRARAAFLVVQLMPPNGAPEQVKKWDELLELLSPKPLAVPVAEQTKKPSEEGLAEKLSLELYELKIRIDKLERLTAPPG